MIRVTQEREGTYTVELDLFERAMLFNIAKGFGMPKSEALAGCISRGFDSTTCILREITLHEEKKRGEESNEE